jgi:hypothetical protein
MTQLYYMSSSYTVCNDGSDDFLGVAFLSTFDETSLLGATVSSLVLI